MSDLSSVGDLYGAEVVEDAEEWQPPAGFAPLPRGRYDLQLEKVEGEVSEKGKTAYVASFVVTQATDENLIGRTVNYIRIWPKPFYRPAPGVKLTKEQLATHKPNTSGVLDFLKAFGFVGGLKDLPRDAVDLEQVLVSFVGETAVDQRVTWEGYDADAPEGKKNLKNKDFKDSYIVKTASGNKVTARERIEWSPRG